MPARPLTMPEREEIRAGTARREADGEIASPLDRRRSTINAEISRNGLHGVVAQSSLEHEGPRRSRGPGGLALR